MMPTAGCLRSPVTVFPLRRPPWGKSLGVRDVNLHVKAGEILGIVGPNGSGKTSLLKLLAKIVRPQKGEITLFGNRSRRLPRMRWHARLHLFLRTISRHFLSAWRKPC